MLQINHLKKQYKDFLLDCSLEVKPGYITGLIGPNGSGKTTTFKAVLDLISIDSGSITLFGKNIKDISNKEKEDIGVALSDSGFSEYLTIKDIIPILSAMYPKFDINFFMHHVKNGHLSMDKQIKSFSTGMKAKLKVLVAMSHHAKLLILDEPTAGLDVIARDELLDMLRDYMEQDENRSILISSHISSDLESLCDDLYMINNGNVVFHEDTDVLLSNYALLKMTNEQYESIDKQYLTHIKKDDFGYLCLSDQRQYYLENYPAIVNEKGNIDDVLTMIVRGQKI